MAAMLPTDEEIKRRDVIDTRLPAGVSQRISRPGVPQEPDAARCEKISHTVEARFPVHVIADSPQRDRNDELLPLAAPHAFEGTRQTPFPTRRVHTGCVSDHTVEVEQNGVVLVARNPKFAVLLPRRLLSVGFARRVILPFSACLLHTVR
jgi:hypothetical protein